jgi:16S rRNA C1402 (ribose-2'-O) methylase RsmI
VEAALAHFSEHRPQGEVTLVIAGAPARRAAQDLRTGAALPPAPAADDAQAGEAAKSMLRAALREGVAPFEAVRRTAEATGLRRNAVYRLWLALKQGAAR